MKKPNLRAMWRAVKAFTRKNSPTLLCVISGCGSIAAIGTAIRDTPDYIRELEKEGLSDPAVRREHPVATVKIFFKHHWITVTEEFLSLLCMYLANHEHLQREAAIAALLEMNIDQVRELKAAIVEEDGEKHLEKIEGRAAQEQIKKADPEKIPDRKDGGDPILEPLSGKTTPLTMEQVRQMAHEFYKRIREGYEFCSVNEWLDLLNITNIGIDEDGVEMDVFSKIGWNGNVYDERDLPAFEIDFTHGYTEDGRPCHMIVYKTPPKYKYEDTFR